jgi:hypothetical protein
MSSVVRLWVSDLQWMCQTVLFCGLRGCDGVPKEDPSKPLTRALRSVVLNNARNDGSFMNLEPPEDVPNLDQYPYHWVGHIMHAVEIVGYCHPDKNVRAKWVPLYLKFCDALHLPPEPKEDMLKRLTGTNG